MIDLNNLYLQSSALWEKDFEEDGFEWIDCHQEANCIYAYKRSSTKQELVTIINFSDQKRDYYMPAENLKKKSYSEVLNSDWIKYGGNTEEKAARHAVKDGYVQITLPAYSAIILK